MRFSHISKLIVAGAFVAGTAVEAQVTVGTPQSNTDANCIPFSCSINFGFTHYQQVYTSSAFSGPMMIGALTFFHTVFEPGVGEFSPGTYNFSLGTTTMAVNGLSGAFADNETSPLAVFASMLIAPNSSAAAASFTVSGSPFLYNPVNGNLLLDIQYTNSPSNAVAFFDSDGSGTVTSRAFGNGEATPSSLGLVTRFDPPAVSATPEPATLMLVATGLLGIGGIARRRKGAAAV